MDAMPMKNDGGKCVPILLPVELIKEIDEKAVGRQEYGDRTEFINDAVRRLLDELEEEDTTARAANEKLGL